LDRAEAGYQRNSQLDGPGEIQRPAERGNGHVCVALFFKFYFRKVQHWKADCLRYAFAMTAWELLAGEVPWLLVPPSELRSIVAQEGDRPDRPSGCSDELWSLLRTSWAHEPSERPSFGIICRFLQDLLQKEDFFAARGSLPSPASSYRAPSGKSVTPSLPPTPKPDDEPVPRVCEF
jgi:hypothetical protein